MSKYGVFSGPYFPAVFNPNLENYGPERFPYLDTFHTLIFVANNSAFIKFRFSIIFIFSLRQWIQRQIHCFYIQCRILNIICNQKKRLYYEDLFQRLRADTCFDIGRKLFGIPVKCGGLDFLDYCETKHI